MFSLEGTGGHFPGSPGYIKSQSKDVVHTKPQKLKISQCAENANSSFLTYGFQKDKNINTLPKYYFEKMNSLWHNTVSYGYRNHMFYSKLLLIPGWSQSSPPLPGSWEWFNLSLWGEGGNFWLLNFPDNLWIIVAPVKASVRNRRLEFLSWGLVLMDVAAPKGRWRQGVSKHILGHRFWKLSTTVPPAVLHFRIHSHH